MQCDIIRNGNHSIILKIVQFQIYHILQFFKTIHNKTLYVSLHTTQVLRETEPYPTTEHGWL